MTAVAAKLKQQMKAKRGAIECVSPAGFEVTIRPPNVEMHALSGGLPGRLKELAIQGVRGIDQAIQETNDGDPDMRTYLDGIVAGLFVSPSFTPPVWALVEVEEGKEGEARTLALVKGDDLDEYLLPADYRWALLVAFGEEDEDGQGRRLWGREPLSRFATFCEEHGCPADCTGRARVVDPVSLARTD